MHFNQKEKKIIIETAEKARKNMERLSLQLCMPYEPCIFNCPYCISRGRKHEHNFRNIYKTQPHKFFERLEKAYIKNQYKSIVITGEADPSQNVEFVKKSIRHLSRIREQHNIKTTFEIQTKNLSQAWLFVDFDVIAFSIDNLKDYQKLLTNLEMIQTFKKNTVIRPTIILSNKWTKKDLKVLLKGAAKFKQLTFKTLQLGENELVNQWILASPFLHEEWLDSKINKLKKKIETSIFYDKDCLNTTGRYEIFRSDGFIYENWETVIAKGYNY